MPAKTLHQYSVISQAPFTAKRDEFSADKLITRQQCLDIGSPITQK